MPKFFGQVFSVLYLNTKLNWQRKSLYQLKLRYWHWRWFKSRWAGLVLDMLGILRNFLPDFTSVPNASRMLGAVKNYIKDVKDIDFQTIYEQYFIINNLNGKPARNFIRG
jgi:hypothetical protein